MKKAKVYLGLMLILAMCSAIVGCGQSASATITLNKQTATVAVGSTSQLVATITNSEQKASWSSDKPAIATVSVGGLVTGVSLGTATITAKVGDVSATCVMTVNLSSIVPVLTLDTSDRTMCLNDKLTIIPALTLNNEAVTTKFTFESTKPAVATIDSAGKIIAVAPGDTIIKVSYSYIGYSETKEIKVKVSENIVMELDKQTVDLVLKVAPGSTKVITNTVKIVSVKIDGKAIASPTITWTTGSATIATVANGIITAKGVGSTIIKANYTSALGNTIFAEIAVNVERDTIAVSEKATASPDWDFGVTSISDKMTIKLPTDLTFASTSIVSIDLIVGDKITRINDGGSLLVAKTALAVGEHSLKIVQTDYIYEIKVVIVKKYYEFVNSNIYAVSGSGTKCTLTPVDDYLDYVGKSVDATQRALAYKEGLFDPTPMDYFVIDVYFTESKVEGSDAKGSIVVDSYHYIWNEALGKNKYTQFSHDFYDENNNKVAKGDRILNTWYKAVFCNNLPDGKKIYTKDDANPFNFVIANGYLPKARLKNPRAMTTDVFENLFAPKA